jgi:hypothetical protein
MGILGSLINGQDVTFDTHQAGDGQPTRWHNVHLEKRLHDGGGKIRYPFLDGTNPSTTGKVTPAQLKKVNKEVRSALKKSGALTDALAQKVVEVLGRFSNGEATPENAREAARTIAGYFDLDEGFVRVVEDYADNRLAFVRTIHFNKSLKTYHQIRQSSEAIEIKRLKSNDYWKW